MSTPAPWVEVGGIRARPVGDPERARLVVVVLHGRSMEADDLAPFGASLGLDAFYLFLEAPLPADPRGRRWWERETTDGGTIPDGGLRDLAEIHPSGLPRARRLLAEVLDGLPLAGRPLVLVGFSQGGMLAFDTLLRGRHRVSALALLSSSRIAHDQQIPLLSERPLERLPVLVSHGLHDEELAFSTGEALRNAVAAAGAEVTFLPFEGGHEIPLLVWRELRKLLQRVTG